MNAAFINADEAKTASLDSLYERLSSSSEGLGSQEAEMRLKTLGPNVIAEKRKSLFLKFFRYFWGPIPWMIELAVILSALLHHWSNLIIILILLIVNGLVGFFEEYRAGNAIEALKKKLSLKCIVKRDKVWKELESSQIVPGDLIRIRLGNIIAADAKLSSGDFLMVDQSVLTGESLPVSKEKGDLVYSGSIAKQGEMEALVLATGSHTFFGKTAKLVEQAGAASHFQKAVLKIGRYLIVISLSLALLLTVVQLFRGSSWLELIQFVLILIIASIPVAMPAVLSVTMALGALRLSRSKAIVTKLESIEEMAGIDVLFCDKTGTLTQNRLKLAEAISYSGDRDPLLISACLASKAENQDPIDLAILNGFSDSERLLPYKQMKFVPFDPVVKRTEATVLSPQGNPYFVTKGAPQVILSLCHPEAAFERKVENDIRDFAEKGYRTLGVASKEDEKKTWQFLGLIALSDPLRVDAKETIADAREHGIGIKMVTGDNIAIAKNISRQLGLGINICAAKDFKKEEIDRYDGFAEIFPEHKFQIIQCFQNAKHLVGMTGDGVNDSPALKQADVGIAVSGATDAARSAASLVLTTPGLSVIIHAIEEAKRIFERMNSYVIYRIAETIRVMLFMVLCILIYNFYPITALMIILLALLNDLPIMTIVYDHTLLEKNPVRWNMLRVLTISTTLGSTGVISSFLLIILVKTYFHLSINELQSLIFLKFSMAGHQTLFIARTKHAFFSKPYPSPILFTAIVCTQAFAALIVGLGIFITPIPWSYVGYLWAYTLVWMFIADGIKNALYDFLGKTEQKS
jgi:H+-transporting ATPase